jgi:hypothetical protein
MYWALYFGATQLILFKKAYEPLATPPHDADRMEAACARVSGKIGSFLSKVSRPKAEPL